MSINNDLATIQQRTEHIRSVLANHSGFQRADVSPYYSLLSDNLYLELRRLSLTSNEIALLQKTFAANSFEVFVDLSLDPTDRPPGHLAIVLYKVTWPWER